MTREEAIHFAECLKHNWTIDFNDMEDFCDMAIEALKEAQKHEETFEWCTDCKEYDKDNYCCHRWSKVIRNTVEELKEYSGLVRCKDCIHWKADNEVFELGFCCVFPQKWVAETFYCADGERREP